MTILMLPRSHSFLNVIVTLLKTGTLEMRKEAYEDFRVEISATPEDFKTEPTQPYLCS